MQKFFLSDENDTQHERFFMDLELWSSRFHTLNNSQNRAKSYSTMISLCDIFLYDHPIAMEKYPNGFFSENTIFIPLDMYERTIDLEPLAVKLESINSYWNLTGLILIPFLTKMIEKKYDVEFSNEEKEKILLSSTEYSFTQTPFNIRNIGQKQIDQNNKVNLNDFNEIIENNQTTEEVNYLSKVGETEIKNFVQEIFNGKEPIFLSNQNIKLFSEENNLMHSVKRFTKQTDDTNFINYALLKNTDMYEKDHPFNQLMEKIKFPSKTIDLLSLDKENYHEVITELSFGQTYILFNAFESLTFQIFNESKTIPDLLGNIAGIWTNLAAKTNDDNFQFLMNILYDNCIQKFPHEDYKKKIDSDITLQIAHCINANPDIDDIKREILIDRLSKLSDDFPTVRTIIYPQNNKKFNMK